MLHVSNELALAIGAYPALIYDFVVRWIYSNAQNNRKTAFVEGMWWTYNTLEYYSGCFSGFMSVRTFQNSVKFLAKKDFLKVKHKGHGRTELWFALGEKIPNVISEALPLNGKYLTMFNAGDAPNNSFNAGDAPNNSFNAKIASFNAAPALKDADAPSNGAASEAPKHINKHTKLKNNNNIKVSKSLEEENKAEKSNEANKNSLTPMSGIIDTLLGELQSSSVVVVENLTNVLGIDFNDPTSHDKIVALGVSLQVEQETMSNLIEKYGLPAVAKQLVNLNYQQKVSPIGNAAGWLVSAVARNYALNQQALDCVKTQKQKQKEHAEYQAKVARIQAEAEEEKKRKEEELLKNGPQFESMPDGILGAWLRHDADGFVEKKYRAYLTGKGIPADQHDKIVAKKRNFRH